MSFSNQTPNYDLPQFLSSDKANWFDLNTAFSVIDTAMQANKTAAANAEGEAANATATAEAVQSALNTIQQNLPVMQSVQGQINSEISASGSSVIYMKKWGPVVSLYGVVMYQKTKTGFDLIGVIPGYTAVQQVNVRNAGFAIIGNEETGTANAYPLSAQLSGLGNNLQVKMTYSGKNWTEVVNCSFYFSICILNDHIRKIS